MQPYTQRRILTWSECRYHTYSHRHIEDNTYVVEFVPVPPSRIRVVNGIYAFLLGLARRTFIIFIQHIQIYERNKIHSYNIYIYISITIVIIITISIIIINTRHITLVINCSSSFSATTAVSPVWS